MVKYFVERGLNDSTANVSGLTTLMIAASFYKNFKNNNSKGLTVTF